MDEMEQRTQHAGRFYRRWGSLARAVFAGMRSVSVQYACGGPGGLLLGSATYFHSVAIAAQPVHRLQIRPVSMSVSIVDLYST